MGTSLFTCFNCTMGVTSLVRLTPRGTSACSTTFLLTAMPRRTEVTRLPRRSTLFRSVLLASCLGSCTGIRNENRPQSAPASIPGQAIAVALEAVPIDSLCHRRCSVVLIDTILRSAERLWPVYPSRNPVVQRFSPSDLPSLGHMVDRLVPVGRWSNSSPDVDTAAVALHLVDHRAEIAGKFLFGCVVLAPGEYSITWAVEVSHAAQGWVVTRSYLYFVR